MQKFYSFLAVLAVVFGESSAVFTDACLNCICQAASGCNPNIGCIMDQGSLSCGPYMLKEPYWIDCGSPGTDFQTCANNMDCAEQCVYAYMNRYGLYCTGGREPLCQDYARIHKGGPNGCTCDCTDDYWKVVSACCGGDLGCD